MTTFADGENGLSVRTKINDVLQHMDGTAGTLVVNEAGADVDFRVESDTLANALFVEGATGFVGLGTGAPSAKMHLIGSGGTILMRLDDASNPRNNYLGVDNYEQVVLSANESDTAGATPSIKFRINAIERMRITTAGNVGIGTSTPSQRLDVNGDASIYGIRAGRGAGAIASNTAFGVSALSANTSGSSNAAFGQVTLQSNTTGSSNVAFGDAALAFNTTGSGNIAVGALALYVNTTGFTNTAVGGSTLFTNTTGSNNVAIGGSALRDNTTGASNTAVGVNALRTNITGGDNTATGLNALYFTTGSNNTANGTGALVNNTTGANNVAVGQTALSGNTTGNSNIAIGQSAGSALTTGFGNTIIGSVAGTAGLANTVIIAAGPNERMRIDSAGSVGIGTATPQDKLQVVGGGVAAQALQANGTPSTYAIGGGLILSYASGTGSLRAFSNASGTGNSIINFITTGAEQMRIDVSGNVGIGTTTPAAKLSTSQVVSAQLTNSVILNGSYAAGNLSHGVGFSINGSAVSAGLYATEGGGAGTNLVFATAVSTATPTLVERMRIDSTGNVAIGSTPSTGGYGRSFEIYSGVTFGGALTMQPISADNSPINLTANAVSAGPGSFKYIASATSATRYEQVTGRHQWFTAPTGTLGATITFTQAMTLDASGNLGLGAVPSAWSGAVPKAIQASGNFGISTTATMYLISNGYYDGASWRYLATGGASYYRQNGGENAWFNAASGTAGNPITFTQAMTLDTSGNLGIGTTTPGYKLDLTSGAGTSIARFAGPANGLVDVTDGTGTFRVQMLSNVPFVGTFSNHSLVLTTNNTERVRIDTAGNVGVGTNAPNAAAILDVQSTTKGVRFPNMTTTQKNAIANVAGLVIFDTTLGKLCVNTGSGWQTITSA